MDNQTPVAAGTIGGRIRSLRRQTNLTQEAFAPTINVSRGYLAKLEADIREPSRKLIRFIAEKYGVTIEWLMTGQGNGGSPDLSQLPGPSTTEILRQRLAEAEQQMVEVKALLATVSADGSDPRLQAMVGQLARIYAEGDPRKLIPLTAILAGSDPQAEAA